MELQPSIPDEMRRRYIERRKADFATVQKAIKEQDSETLQRVGHQIKGNAATFAYLDLEMIGIQLEESGVQNDFARASLSAAAFGDWLALQEGVLMSRN